MSGKIEVGQFVRIQGHKTRGIVLNRWRGMISGEDRAACVFSTGSRHSIETHRLEVIEPFKMPRAMRIMFEEEIKQIEERISNSRKLLRRLRKVLR